ncbi:protein TIFY 6B-like isoform X2 [Andrographis paniculata]|uniref:protein TIFY 6B-like isoform X2 n=1 Tax=Andrographis paniculata TaxID=175694 RepID=UPI0021E8710E|nr:protein TIFY 6B-like isoform X2 [Andrographis paniculata]
MERDFLGLAVKQEITDESTDAAALRSSTMHWSFPNKASFGSNLLSFQEDKPLKAGFDSLASTGLVAITTDSFDSDNKFYGPTQINGPEQGQGGGGRYAAASFNNQMNLKLSPFAPASVHRSFIDPNPMGSLSLASQPVPPVPFSNPVTAVPSSTDLRNGSKIPQNPSNQLTIFYNGSVCVYDNISSNKAQAIMLLAGNGSPAPRAPVLDPFVVSQPHVRTSSPIEVTPLSIAPPVVHPCNNDTIPTKPARAFMPSSFVAEPLKAANTAKFVPSDTVPQFRKKSLARFLEKRKERVINASPYAAAAALKEPPDSSKALVLSQQ